MPLSTQISELTRHLHRTAELAREYRRSTRVKVLPKATTLPSRSAIWPSGIGHTCLGGCRPRYHLVGEESSEELRNDSGGQLAGLVCDILKPLHADPTAEQLFNILDRGQYTPNGSQDRFWVLDPIDGTKGFLRGDQYAIALGHISAGEVTAGTCAALPQGLQIGWSPLQNVVLARG